MTPGGPRYSPETHCPKVPSRWRRSMPVTSSADFLRAWETAGHCCWVKSSTAKVAAATLRSRVRAHAVARGGDGKAAVGPMLREVLISEAMHALGIPTTRALAVAATGEEVYRDRALPGAVLTRVAASHIRVGTFEFYASRGDVDRVRKLAEYTIARHDPSLVGMPD